MIETPMGAASEELLHHLRTLFQTRTHSPMWRATNFAHIRALQEAGQPVTAAFATTLARFLEGQPELPPHQPATGHDYDQLRYAIDRREVPEPFHSWLCDRIDQHKLSHVFVQLALDDLAKLPKKTRRGHHTPKGIPATEVPDGYYAIEGATQARGCYSLRTKDGRQIVRAINFETGRRPEVRDRQAHRIVAAIALDLNEAQRRFGEVAKRCTACNQHIEDGENNPGFPYGYGPKCWADLQAATAAAPALPISTDLEASNA